MEKMYFDYASTAPTDPLVVEAMKPYFYEKFGNASSPHHFGQEALSALEDARQVLAGFIGATPEEIVFNSGGTEANNHAICGIYYKSRIKDSHMIVSAIEHHSVLEPVEFLQRQGAQITILPVDSTGQVNPEDVKKAITNKTILVAVMHASNEIGTVQPVKDISAITKAKGVPLLVDAVQTVGHIPVNVKDLGADMLSLSAHKFYGPKGVGALYVRKGLALERYMMGGDQERSHRASTQNVAGIVGLGKAISLCRDKMPEEIKTQTALRQRLLEEIPKRISGVKINGHPTNRLPNNAHFSFEGLHSEALLMSLDMNGFAASMGSACTAGAMDPSHVLKAIGLDDALAFGSLRLSLGRWTTAVHVDRLLNYLPEAVKSLRI